MKKSTKNPLKFRIFLAVFSLFFACFSLFSLSTPAFAVPEDAKTPSETSEEAKKSADEAEHSEDSEEKKEEKKSDEEIENICTDQAKALGWLICPGSGALSKAIDSIYGSVEEFLVINPIPADESSTIHIVWEYVKGVTNIVFIIFLLVVVYSHLTGYGISNYNLKRILPRIIVVAILVNLSFLICQIFIDISNLIGYSIHDLFINIEKDAIARGTIRSIDITWDDLVSFVTGTATAAGLTISLTGGLATMFWTLVPVLVGAIVSIAIGFITIAMRQALVSVLVMISPLAFVCFLLPNTEKWFEKWKDNLSRMLIFYPAFSFLFGASHLAGWAIITSSVDADGNTSGFGVLLGLAVQVFPLFFSWSLMKMSGTVLGAVNQRLHGLASRPLGAIGRASMLNRDLARSKYLGSTPKGVGQEVMQRISDRQIRKVSDSMHYKGQAKLRGDAYASRIRKKNGEYTKRAEDFYEMQADAMDYQRDIQRTKNDFNRGLGYIASLEQGRGLQKVGAKAGSEKYERLQYLDQKTIRSSDNLKFEQARGEKIDYENAVGFHNRVEDAINANTDRIHSGDPNHKSHLYLDNPADPKRAEGLKRYEKIKEIMEGEEVGVFYAKANAASSYATQAKIIDNKLQTAFALTPATQDIENQVRQLTLRNNSTENIDQIVAGLRTISARGDTDIVKKLIDDTLVGGKVQLGTHASQSLANFLMFDVKDSDPMLRRYGKYINLETAQVYNTENANPRLQHNLSFNEYITGEYLNPNGTIGHSKRSASQLLEGTSLDNVERTFYKNLDESTRKAFALPDGTLSESGKENFLKKRKELYNAMGPAFISASLKYPSGSEQLVSAVSYLTGFKEKNGQLVERWNDPDDALYGLDEDYFRECAENYLRDQIPSQILSMRTDYRKSLTEHLLRSLLADSENHPEEIAEYESALSEIENDPDLDPAKKSKAKSDLAIKTAGVKARDIWEKNGTLAQLYKSRRSGAANNAKPFVRTWANLDNETEILDYMDKLKGSEEDRKTESFRENRKNEIDLIYERNRDNVESFFEASLDIVFEHGLRIIYKKYEKYHNDHPHSTSAELLDYLKSLIDDPNNY